MFVGKLHLCLLDLSLPDLILILTLNPNPVLNPNPDANPDPGPDPNPPMAIGDAPQNRAALWDVV